MISEPGTALRVASTAELGEGVPHPVVVNGVDVVLVRRGDVVSALYGRCAHRGALMADGRFAGPESMGLWSRS
ncbi:hypothetical protein BST33_18220 [Mycolicibacter minnesotensis]|uniref:Rieske domain-containing protein n=1 Tax=Mycolicibacter minnesotensis TaxID=1118379 RepID=A0AA91M2E7_9MYCO|nr:Rieske 2Fe-2S domain-containing protein [Mycolicibacter minnesotensis]ORA97767.1 hypothetical protein BST33_18220 [Mycolicibacter minnesotensis]